MNGLGGNGVYTCLSITSLYILETCNGTSSSVITKSIDESVENNAEEYITGLEGLDFTAQSSIITMTNIAHGNPIRFVTGYAINITSISVTLYYEDGGDRTVTVSTVVFILNI